MKKRTREVFHNNLVEENMIQNPEYQSFLSFRLSILRHEGCEQRNPQKNKAAVVASHYFGFLTQGFLLVSHNLSIYQPAQILLLKCFLKQL
ncbi:MAG: hypothetical protein A2W85_11715 [Bacteroidetes bacterium GWF2_41_31]|nr:MAG: hypothetical protein A2W85_11715 [Bacteroidetes bacterium GWF2_41_31]